MKVTAECIPCYLNQCLNAMEKGGVPGDRREELLIGLLPVIAGLDRTLSPAENSTIILHKLVETIGGDDPFRKAKEESNRTALQFVPGLRRLINEAEDPVRQAVKFSVAGNVVDMGLFDDYDLRGALDGVLKTGFRRDDYPLFMSKLKNSRRVVIIGDNSGEIVFDRLLAEVLTRMGIEVIYGVKGSFILNDATIEDAYQAGLQEVSRVIDSGNNCLGTIEGRCSEDFLKEIRECDLVISKGQANYESLEGTNLAGEKTFFLLKAKCPVVAANLGVDYGDIVFVQNRFTGGCR
ncbi:MAG: hypothetical protein CVU89_07650 [Firmicutes bacterium HGW-Firmicutes-14]|nr:MAG: hypothetical protein CVU89_07650 [Firmicutes bacterium HGW-Firmicutes-14]